MVAQCRSRLAVRPHSIRAVLIYSQHLYDTLDNASMHGGYPVTSDKMLAASEYVAAAHPIRSPRRHLTTPHPCAREHVRGSPVEREGRRDDRPDLRGQQEANAGLCNLSEEHPLPPRNECHVLMPNGVIVAHSADAGMSGFGKHELKTVVC